MEKKISYLSRTYDDFKKELIELSKKYYPDLAINYDDASVASWMLDINADAADAISYNIDRVYQETNIESAQEKGSLYNIARNNGVKIPGPKGAIVEVKFSCYVPLDSVKNEPDWKYAPKVKRGTRVASSTQNFELLYDVDFTEAFNEDGVSDRTITPVFDSNGFISKYQITKLAIVVAGETRVYKQTITASDIKPFMEIVLPVENVMNIESIVVKEGNSIQAYPSYGEFYMPNETSTTYKTTTRFFEVNNLAEQKRWGDYTENNMAVKYQYGYSVNNNLYPVYSVTKGEWKPVQHKFITEYTNNGYLKVVFGAGIDPRVDVNIDNGSDFMKYMASKTIKNDNMGILPKQGSTVFILYRSGGGKASNVAEEAIQTISVLNIEIPATSIAGSDINKISDVKSTFKVKNTTPSVSGKDMPTNQELKYMIKYNKGAQERCVTVNDYIDRVLAMPPKYGTPFRVGAAEDNNKIMLYLLGVDYNGKLDSALPAVLVENIQNYIKEYRMINDYVEIKAGKIINLSFDIEAYIDKNYDRTEIFAKILSTVKEYMDINNRQMGDDIFIGDIEKEISKVDGVIGLIDVKVYNEYNSALYSSTQTAQEVVTKTDCITEGDETYTANRVQLDLDATDGVIYSDGDTMLEVKYDSDIRVQFKEK